MSFWKVILATMVIFGCGVLTGAFVTGQRPAETTAPPSLERPAQTQKPPAGPTWQLQRVEFLHRIEKNLELTAEQRARIEKIMRESQDRTKPLWDQIAPQMREELRRVREEIRAELTPEQQKKFESLLKKSSRKDENPPTGELKKSEGRKRKSEMEPKESGKPKTESGN